MMTYNQPVVIITHYNNYVFQILHITFQPIAERTGGHPGMEGSIGKLLFNLLTKFILPKKQCQYFFTKTFHKFFQTNYHTPPSPKLWNHSQNHPHPDPPSSRRREFQIFHTLPPRRGRIRVGGKISPRWIQKAITRGSSCKSHLLRHSGEPRIGVRGRRRNPGSPENPGFRITFRLPEMTISRSFFAFYALRYFVLFPLPHALCVLILPALPYALSPCDSRLTVINVFDMNIHFCYHALTFRGKNPVPIG